MSTETLITALDGLQNDSQRRQEYNEWLQNFQRGSEAWEVVYEVLSSPNFAKPLKIFAAQTLRNKIAFDLHQVPKEARLNLKNQVLSLLQVNADLLHVVGVQLCIALAAFAMQVADWENPVLDLITQFSSPDMVPLLFEFLKVLPEEFNSERAGLVDFNLRLQRSTHLIQDNASVVLNFMLSQASMMSQTGDYQTLFFEALLPWLNEVNLDEIVASPLVSWMFQCLQNESSRSAAVDCLILVIKEASEIYETSVIEAIKVLFPQLIEASNTLSKEYEDDSDLHRDMTRLLSEAGLSWHALIAKDPGNFMPLLEAVVLCVLVPQPDLETIEFTFDFFDKLRTMLGEQLPDTSAPLNKQVLNREPFIQIFMTLFAAFNKLLEFPDSFNGNLEEEEIFRDFRYDIGDMLKVCSSIAGHENALKYCHDQLDNMCVECAKWQPLEAILFSIRAIARTVPLTEDVWLPKIHILIQSIPFQTQETVQHASLMMLGRYSQWSARNPKYLQLELGYIITAVWSPYHEVQRAAAHAFLYLCTDAAEPLVEFWRDMLDFYSTLSGKVDIELMCKYSDAVGAIVNKIPYSEQADALNVLYTPVLKQVEALKYQVEVSKEQEKVAAYDIQGLGSVIAMITIDTDDQVPDNSHPIIACLNQYCETFADLLQQYGPKSPLLLEGISRYLIHSLFVGRLALGQHMFKLMEAVLSVSTYDVYPVLFDLSSAILQSSNNSEQVNKQLYDSVWEFSKSMCLLLFSEKVDVMMQEQGEITDYETDLNPIIHNGFHFLCDLCVYYSQNFFEIVYEHALQMSVKVFNLVWDTDSLIAVSHFYDDVESFVPSILSDNDNTESATKIRSYISAGIEKHGYSILHSMFYWFLLKGDPTIEPLAGRIVDFTFRLAPVASIGWLQQILADLPAGTVSDEEKLTFAAQVFQLMSACRFRGIGHEMCAFVKAYSARNFTPR